MCVLIPFVLNYSTRTCRWSYEARGWRAPGDLEDAEEACAAEDGEAERRHELRLHEHGLDDAPEHDREVEPVELAEEVALEAVREHLERDLQREQRQERHVRPVFTQQR